MSNHLQQQQHHANAAGFYPSTSYFQEPKSLIPTSAGSVYDQSMTLPPQSDAEQDMVDAVTAFSTTSLPPLSQLLPSSATTSSKPMTNAQQPTSLVSVTDSDETLSNKSTDTNNPTLAAVRAYSHSTISSNSGMTNDHLTMTPTTTATSSSTPHPRSMYQPLPTVMSHRKVPSNHPEMYYRSPVVASAVTPPNATTNEPYYLSMPGYNPATTEMVPQPASNSNVNSLHFPTGTMTSSVSTTVSTVPSHPPPYTTTGDIQQVQQVPSQSTVRHRHSHQGIYHPHSYSYLHHPNSQHQHLPSPPSSYDQYPMEQQQSQKVFSFVSLPGVNQKKRPRRKYHEVERLYHCNYLGCSKSYGTLNHLNAHVCMQSHGPKRHPSEFKELRKMWRKQKRESQGKTKKNGSSHASVSQHDQMDQYNQRQQQHKAQASPHHSVQSHHHIHAPPPLPSMPSNQVQPLIHHSMPPPPSLPTVLYPPPSNPWMTAIPPPPTHHPVAQSNMPYIHHPQSNSHPHSHVAAAAAAGFPTNTINYQ